MRHLQGILLVAAGPVRHSRPLVFYGVDNQDIPFVMAENFAASPFSEGEATGPVVRSERRARTKLDPFNLNPDPGSNVPIGQCFE